MDTTRNAIVWLARFPDLNFSVWDFLVWDYLKILVYKTSIYNENILQMRIIDKCKKIEVTIKLFKFKVVP